MVRFFGGFILSLLASSHAMAEPAICQDAVKAVCEKRVDTSAENIGQILATRAASEVNRYLGESYPTDHYTNLLRQELADRPKKYGLVNSTRAIIRGFLYIGCSDYLARAYFSGDSEARTCFSGVLNQKHFTYESIFAPLANQDHFRAINSSVEEARSLVKAVLRTGHLSEDLTAALEKRLDDTQPLSVLEFIQNELLILGRGNAKDIPDVLSAVMERCDFDNTDLNAFNVPNVVGARLILCPSLWVNGIGRNRRGEAGTIMSVILHEMGHSVEHGISLARVFTWPDNEGLKAEAKARYAKVISCMKNQYVVTGKLTANLPVFSSDTEKTEFYSALDFKPKAMIADVFYGEYSADVISAKAFALYLKRYSNQKQRAYILKRNLDYLCDQSRHDPIVSSTLLRNLLHPSGPFRIENIYLSAPELRNALGCASQSVSKSCSLF